MSPAQVTEALPSTLQWHRGGPSVRVLCFSSLLGPGAVALLTCLSSTSPHLPKACPKSRSEDEAQLPLRIMTPFCSPLPASSDPLAPQSRPSLHPQSSPPSWSAQDAGHFSALAPTCSLPSPLAPPPQPRSHLLQQGPRAPMQRTLPCLQPGSP